MTRSLSRDLFVNVIARSDLAAVMSKEVKSAEASAKVFERELNRMEAAEKRAAAEAERVTRARHDAYTKAGLALTAFGAAVTAGLGMATKAAIGWESAWAGVTKTVDGTRPQMDRLEGNLRELARTLPATHTEIAAVAEAAGALGIKRESIVSFTKTMIDLGETTDLTSDQAANALARIANVMGTSQDDIDRLGAALVELGNNGASTEGEIVEMAQRIAGAGNQIGLTEGEVLGFASALSSVGINAEAGGSSISTAFIKISEAVNKGGEELDLFAELSGMTSEQFAKAFKDDAATAITAFIGGLGRMQKSGGDVFAVLDALGLSETRMRDAMLRTAGAGDLLSESIETGNRAWIENSALTEEADKRYQTTAARMAVARNQVNDFAITVGETFLPAVGEATGRMGAWMEVMRELPEPVTNVLGMLGGVAGAASLAGGAFFLAAPKVAEFNKSLADMGPKGQAFGKGLQNTASILGGPYGIALGIATLALGSWLNQKAQAAQTTRDFTKALEADTGAIGRNTRETALHKLEQEDAGEAAQRLGLNMSTVTDAALGNEGALAALRGQLEPLTEKADDFGVANRRVARDAQTVLDAINLTSEGLVRGRDAFQRQTEAMGEQEIAHESTASAARRQAAAQSELNVELGDGVTLAEKLEDELEALTGAHIAADEAQLRWIDSVHRATEGIKENGRSLNLNTVEGRANRQAILDSAQAATDHIVAMANEGRSYEEVRAKGIAQREELIRLAMQFGLNRNEAQAYIDRLYQIPPERTTLLSVQEERALAEIREFERQVNLSLKNIEGDRHLTIAFGPGRIIRARGGPVDGPGTETSDSIPAMLSRGEHVWSAREVRAAGGHEAMYQMRAAALHGRKLAKGGPVDWWVDINVATSGIAERLAAARQYISQFAFGPVGNLGAGVQRWAPLVLQALAMMGQPASLLGVTLRRMQQESGGNPNAINLWDVNAQRGDPSRGLMQTIWGTFVRYHFPGTSWNIYDPLANILASMRYALARYGSLASAYNRPGGYDEGGMLGPPLNATGRPERVLSPQQTQAFDQLVSVLTTRRGTQGVVENHYHLHSNRPESTVRAEFERMQLLYTVV